MLTPDEREAVIKRVLGDSVVQAMDALRAETRRFCVVAVEPAPAGSHV
jgi:hypothetical protein